MPLFKFQTRWMHLYFDTCAQDFIHDTKKQVSFQLKGCTEREISHEKILYYYSHEAMIIA